MNAIQRWYFYRDRDGGQGEHPLVDGNVGEMLGPLWCKAQDVAELERVIADQSAKIAPLRDRVHFLERMLLDLQKDTADERGEHAQLRDRHLDLTLRHDAIMRRYPDHPEELHKKLDALLAHCPDGECYVCAAIICPHQDALHFHHDGCPSCAEDV